MVSRKLYEIIGIVCGFALIDYGFNFIALGLPGARELTSQIIGVNLLGGGSAVIFISVFYLLRPTPQSPQSQQETTGALDIGVETVVEEQTPPQYRFYKNIEYIGYCITAIGLFSAADLVLQVFIYQTYNEARWWVEILLVVFGVLAYAIFGSIGRIGAAEERALVTAPQQDIPTMTSGPMVESTSQIPDILELNLDQFTRSASGEYEHKLTDHVYDMVSVRPEVANVWREDRKGMRSVYLAGPYELSRELLHEHSTLNKSVKIGILTIAPETIKSLLSLQEQLQARVPSGLASE